MSSDLTKDGAYKLLRDMLEGAEKSTEPRYLVTQDGEKVVIDPYERIRQQRLKTEQRRQEAEAQRQAGITQTKLNDGLKPFEYPKGVVWAMNKRNADRKAKNQGLL